MIDNHSARISTYSRITSEISDLANLCMENLPIDPELYSQYEVKRGLRDINGKGVLAGLTDISKIKSYIVEDNDMIPCEGKLYYQGVDVEDIVAGFIKEKRFGFEETTYLLLFGKLPTPDELDTIIVPAREDGFNEEFLKNDRWYAIRISSAMIDKIKYIAAYQVAPISGITYVAEVDRIEKYKDTNKYIVLFKTGTLKKINKVSLGQKKGLAPQAPRYSSYKTIISAKSLDDLWS